MSLLCPSSRCKDGAILVGIVLGDGRVAFAQDRLVVDAAFVENATKEGSREPERRFRFGSPCAKAGCHQWTGSRCGVIDAVMDDARALHAAVDDSLPNCAIRSECRWFDQAGAEACAVCDLVVTETRAPARELASR